MSTVAIGLVEEGGSVGQTIWRAIMDMHGTKRSITRQALSDMTGLKLTLIDDHVKRMRSDGRLRLIVNGVFEPVIHIREDRAVSGTVLPESDEPVIVEIGETVLKLTFREARNLGALLAGFGIQFRG